MSTPAPPAAPRATRTAWLIFAPPFAATALHLLLGQLAERGPALQPLRQAQAAGEAGAAAASAAAVAWQASQPVLLALAGVVALGLIARGALRRWGWPRVRPWATRLWLLAWALAGASLLLQHLNRAALQPRPDVAAQVLQARPQPSSERGPGGALALLRLAGDTAPRRVLLEGADFRALPPGTWLVLQRADGRWWGQYVTGSDAPLAARAEDAGAPPPAR